MDLTQYSDSELSMWVLNDECLYRQYMRADSVEELERVVGGFEYTQAQFDELVEDWESEDRE